MNMIELNTYFGVEVNNQVDIYLDNEDGTSICVESPQKEKLYQLVNTKDIINQNNYLGKLLDEDNDSYTFSF